MCRLGLFGNDQLQMMTQGGLNRGDILVGHADFVRQRAEHLFRIFQRGKSARAETLVLGLQLLQHVQTRAFLRLLL